ncbi:MAG: hypothetical protein QOD99_2287, partial [Chthoniobacter sp.]|nr:hypothetical protein [Chthoniobacter sp.]
MKNIASSIEPLEARIAPAGVVVATLDHNGALMLSTAASDVSVLIEHFPDGAWLLDGLSANTVQFNGATA